MFMNMKPDCWTENSVDTKRNGKHTHGTRSHFHKTADYVGFSAGVGIYNVLYIIVCLIFSDYCSLNVTEGTEHMDQHLA